MGYTNETTHYSIPLPLGSDKTTPMDYNTSAQEVDTVLFEAKTDSASALQKANQLQQDLSTTNDNVTSVTGRVTTLEGTVTTQGGAILQNTQDISDVRADALDMIEAKDEGTAQVATVAVAKGEYFRYNDVLYIATQNIAVGDTIVPNNNCRATNVGTELTDIKGNMVSTNDLAVSSDSTSLIGSYIMKQNRNIEIHLQGAYADDIASFTLPRNLRPQHDVRNTCLILTTDGTLIGLFRVKADGTIEISSVSTYGASLTPVSSHESRVYGEIKFFTAS